MSYNNTGRAALLNSGKAGVTHIGLLTDLSTTEVAGATRQAVTWGSPASGKSTNSGAINVPVNAGQTPMVVGHFDAVSAGNLLGIFGFGSSGQLVKGVGSVISAAGDTIQSNGHGLTTDDRVFFSAVTGEALPTGISATVLYFVLASGLTADAFKVSTTSGGGALDITALGEVYFQKTVPNLYASAGQVSFAIGDLSIDFTGI